MSDDQLQNKILQSLSAHNANLDNMSKRLDEMKDDIKSHDKALRVDLTSRFDEMKKEIDLQDRALNHRDNQVSTLMERSSHTNEIVKSIGGKLDENIKLLTDQYSNLRVHVLDIDSRVGSIGKDVNRMGDSLREEIKDVDTKFNTYVKEQGKKKEKRNDRSTAFKVSLGLAIIMMLITLGKDWFLEKTSDPRIDQLIEKMDSYKKKNGN